MLKILHLEDDPVDASMILELLREDGFEAESDRVETMAQFSERLERGGYGLILADFTLPGVNTTEALKLARRLRPEVPFLFLSATLPEERAIETLKLGASDYVFKQRIGRLVPSIRRALQEAEDQARRKQAEAMLRAVTEGVEEAIFVKDQHSRYLMINAAGIRRFGRKTQAEVLGKEDHEFFPPEVAEAIRSRDRQVMASGKPQTYEETLPVGDALRVFLTSKAPYHAHDGAIIGVLGISHDITDRKLAEQQIRHLNETLEQRVQQRTQELHEANANLQAFAGTAAHDLRSPLRAIISFSAFALEEYGSQLEEMGRSYLERIHQSAEQMSRLLTDLLEYSRVSQAQLKLQPVNLQTAVQEALNLLQADLGAKQARVSTEGPFPAVIGHEGTVVLLINNLVSNALKFVLPNVPPQVRIWAELVQRRGTTPAGTEMSATNLQAANWVRLWVEDAGIGISEADQKKLFVVFQRLHGKQAYPGTGLGLAIVRRGAERMGGRVGVESEVGKGSRFWVELPKA
ncbi:putative Histidine kinase [Verrucomicrobia bacterium]|nr:putative Histidine kinase [Verrucomicrobiota bacterium]